MKESPIKLYPVQNLDTTIPVTPATQVCNTLGFPEDWVAELLSSCGLHRMYIDGQLQLSYYQASLLNKGVPLAFGRKQHQQDIDSSFFLHFVNQNPGLHG